jgi:hypothetical protein
MSGLALPPDVCRGCAHLGPLRGLGVGRNGLAGAEYPCLLGHDQKPLYDAGATCPHRVEVAAPTR